MPPIKIDLPILTANEAAADAARTSRSNASKYGGLWWLSIAGLVVITSLLGWFGWNVWAMRDVWTWVHVLNDAARPEVERVEAARALSLDARVSPRQRWDLCLSLHPPALGRYLLAESLDDRALEGDASAYALAVARSEGWSDWLRLQLVRPLAYGAGRYALPSGPLAELRKHPDRAIALWADYAAALGRDDQEARDELHKAAREDAEPHRALAGLLETALRADAAGARKEALDRATRWARAHHGPSAEVWQGWEEADDRIVTAHGGR